MNTLIKNPIDLDDFELKKGKHSGFEAGACLLETASYLAGEPFTDHPQCVDPVLTGLGIHLNDTLEKDRRQVLKQYLVDMIGTRDDGLSEQRKLLRVDWNLRIAMPMIFDALGRTEYATELRAFPEVVDEATRAEVKRLWDEFRARLRATRQQTWAAFKAAPTSENAYADAYAYAYAYADAYAYAYAYAYADAYAYANAYANANANAPVFDRAALKAHCDAMAQKARDVREKVIDSKIDLFARMVRLGK